jgi:hypothetical protein
MSNILKPIDVTDLAIRRAVFAVAAMTKARCSISNGVLHGYGRKAQPVSDGLCCTRCNHAHVIPARLARLPTRDAKRESKGAVKASKHLAGSNKTARVRFSHHGSDEQMFGAK